MLINGLKHTLGIGIKSVHENRIQSKHIFKVASYKTQCSTRTNLGFFTFFSARMIISKHKYKI